MKFPFIVISRDKYDELDARLKDIERHFVTKRNAQGEPTETLADVPMKERKERRPNLSGMSLQQKRHWLEQTDGGKEVLARG